MERESKLLLYKASAGSGKTHQLSHTYSDFLIEDYDNNPDAYKHILAVTFTNAATQEMKERILQTLDSIAKEDADMAKREKAQAILSAIVHDYSMFRVSTIDSFFQSVLRSFAFEMGKRSSYELNIENDRAVAEAVDSMYSELANNKDILKTLIEISLSNIENESGWDFRKKIVDFCSQIIGHEFLTLKSESDDFLKSIDKDSIADIIVKIDSYSSSFYLSVKNTYDSIRRKFELSGLQKEDFKGKSKSPVFKFLSGNIAKNKIFIDPIKRYIIRDLPVEIESWKGEVSVEDWCTDDSACQKMQDMYNSVIDDVGQLINLFVNRYKYYQSYSLIKENIRETSLLSYVNEKLREYCNKENISLISETPSLIHQLISGSDTPFIYEKIGVTLKHFLLDEFQDTSKIQWDNFRPLISESLHNGYRNMLVGDVKQSIYRWRGGEWDILNSQIENIYSQYIEPINKQTNYRSRANIVNFNNALFSSQFDNSIPAFVAKSIDSQTIRDIYSDSSQQVSPFYQKSEQRGYVEVICAEKQSDAIVGYDTFLFYNIYDIISRLTSDSTPKEQRYDRGDIAILTPTNAQGSAISSFLMNKGIKVVSSDSLMIDSSITVLTIIAILRYVVDKKNKEFSILSALNGIELRNREQIESISPSTSVYDLCENLIRNHLNDASLSDTIFISAFMDKVLDYSTTKGSSIYGFLRWWDENSKKFAIESPPNKDAVIVKTMHKAKGLAFKVVIVPYIREFSTNKLGSHWCNIEDKDFITPAPAYIPFRDTKKIDSSLYKEDFKREYHNAMIDCINLLYVSFTRPKEKLYIFAPLRENSKQATLASGIDLFCNSCQVDGRKLFDCQTLEVNRENYTSYSLQESELLTEQPFVYKRYTFGNECEAVDRVITNSSSEVVSIQQEERYELQKKSLRVSKFGEDDDIRHKGILFHQLYSNISDDSDESILSAVSQLISHNASYIVIGNSEEDIFNIVKAQIDSVKDYGWFSKDNLILREKEILSDGKLYRPDRIIISSQTNSATVVDFKFGLAESKIYHKQVRDYSSLLTSLGYENVSGYLWYVFKNEVVKVV